MTEYSDGEDPETTCPHGVHITDPGGCPVCDAPLPGSWVCRYGHPLNGIPDHCGQVWCEPCRAHMTPREAS